MASTAASLPLVGEARQGNGSAVGCRPPAETATLGKSVALACLNAAIDASGAPRKALAYECGLTESQFSKLTSGAQGFPLTLLDRFPREIVADFLERMRERHDDPVAVAAEQFITSGIRFLRLARALNRDKARTAKASL